jgi:hypothetical protein
VSAGIAVLAFAALLLLIGVTAAQIDAADWEKVRSAATAAGRIPIADAITGYAFAWLAFSGLESLAQISPAMGPPRRRTAGIAMLLVVIASGTAADGVRFQSLIPHSIPTPSSPSSPSPWAEPGCVR